MLFDVAFWWKPRFWCIWCGWDQGARWALRAADFIPRLFLEGSGPGRIRMASGSWVAEGACNFCSRTCSAVRARHVSLIVHPYFSPTAIATSTLTIVALRIYVTYVSSGQTCLLYIGAKEGSANPRFPTFRCSLYHAIYPQTVGSPYHQTSFPVFINSR